jgi:hypothetical protein
MALALAVAAVCGGCLQPAGSTPSSVDVRFSPNGGCTDVAQIDAAQSSVLVQAYSFTSAPIAQALVAAHQRGLDVRVLLDKSQRSEKYTSADFLARAGVPTAIDAQHAIAHNKIMIIDGAVVVTGSFNFTKSAEQSNAENLLILHDPALAEKYTANWLAHARHCETYEAEAPQSPPPTLQSRPPTPTTRANTSRRPTPRSFTAPSAGRPPRSPRTIAFIMPRAGKPFRPANAPARNASRSGRRGCQSRMSVE